MSDRQRQMDRPKSEGTESKPRAHTTAAAATARTKKSAEKEPIIT